MANFFASSAGKYFQITRKAATLLMGTLWTNTEDRKYTSEGMLFPLIK